MHRPCTLKVCRKYRSSHQSVLQKKVFLEIWQKSQENTCARHSFLIKNPWNKCFTENFAKFLRTPFLQNTSEQLLLEIQFNLQCSVKSLPRFLAIMTPKYEYLRGLTLTYGTTLVMFHFITTSLSYTLSIVVPLNYSLFKTL